MFYEKEIHTNIYIYLQENYTGYLYFSNYFIDISKRHIQDIQIVKSHQQQLPLTPNVALKC